MADRRPARHTRHTRIALLLLAAACAGGDAAPPPDADGAAPAAARLDSATAGDGGNGGDTGDTLAFLDTTSFLDSTANGGVPPLVTAPADNATTPLDTAVAIGVAAAGDTVAVAPTLAELAALRAALVVPVQGVPRDRLVRSFSDARGTRTHHALDIPAPRGTPVLSATGGRLLKLFDSEAGGLMVYAADSSGRFVLLYSHLDAYAPGLTEGMPLRRGQPLGTVGTTGNAPPGVPHLHFGIARTRDVEQWWRGLPVDPYALLRERER